MNKHTILVIAVLLLLTTGCKREWSTHDDITDPNIQLNLFERIQQDASLTAFSNLLVKTGYDAALAASKAYTVWAPENDAIQQVAANILNNDSLLKLFVGSHISLQPHLTSEPQPVVRVRTLSGKYYDFTATGFDEAAITTANAVANNGILHHLNAAIVPKQSIWQYVQSAPALLQQKQFITSLNYTATDSTTGKPVIKNHLFDSIADISNEAAKYTYFLLTDNAYTTAFAQLKPFFVTGSADSTNALANWRLVKDLAVAGVYTIDQLPDTLLSTTGIKIPVNKQAIVGSYKASNGLVYVMDQPASRVQDKFPSVIVEGEAPVAFSRTDKTANIFYRVKSAPCGHVFRDIQAYGHATPLFTIKYEIPNLPSGTYRVYWRAVAGNNDAQTVAFQQRLALGNPAVALPYKTVNLNNCNEEYIGEYTVTQFGTLPVYLLADNSATTGVNTLSLDYLRLQPTF